MQILLVHHHSNHGYRQDLIDLNPSVPGLLRYKDTPEDPQYLEVLEYPECPAVLDFLWDLWHLSCP